MNNKRKMKKKKYCLHCLQTVSEDAWVPEPSYKAGSNAKCAACRKQLAVPYKHKHKFTI
jgi:hypothetical protein